MSSHTFSQSKAAMRGNLKLGCQLCWFKAQKKPQPISEYRWREFVSAAANRLDKINLGKRTSKGNVCVPRVDVGHSWSAKQRGVIHHKDASGLLTTNLHSNSKQSRSVDWTITWQQLVSLWEGTLRINATTNFFCRPFTEIRRNQVIQASWFCNVVILVARRYWKAYVVLPLMITKFISSDSCP